MLETINMNYSEFVNYFSAVVCVGVTILLIYLYVDHKKFEREIEKEAAKNPCKSGLLDLN